MSKIQWDEKTPDCKKTNPVQYYHTLFDKKTKIDKDEAIETCFEFLLNLSKEEGCPQVSSKRPTKCTCLQECIDPSNPDEVMPVAEYMVYFAKMSHKDQFRTVSEWIRYSKHFVDTMPPAFRTRQFLQRRYILPGCPKIHKICQNALAFIIGFKKTKWGRICKTVKDERVPKKHGLAGKPSNNKKSRDQIAKMHAFLKKIEDLAVPRAAEAVGDETGEIERGDTKKKNVVELPSFMSKRGLYVRFCDEELGWKVTADAKGTFHYKEKIEGRGVPYPSWGSFWGLWSREFKHMVISSSPEDEPNIIYN